jgi:hypothetical protein
VICAQENINQTTGYLYALEKQLSQHQKHLLLRFAHSKAEVMHALEELSCGLCDDILVIGARFPLDVEMDNVILVDCMESDNSNSISSITPLPPKPPVTTSPARGVARLR